jgi:transcription-repair coupling factor (superfamily II helicase)
VIAFRDNSFANPEGLVRYIAQQGSLAKVRPDMTVVFMDDFATPADRMRGTASILRDLVDLTRRRKAA